jgi:hypothetical protein
MSKQQHSLYSPAPKSHARLFAFGAFSVLAIVTAAYLVLSSGSPSTANSSPALLAPGSSPTISLPSLPSGSARVGNIEVMQQTLDLGKQPLNVAIQPAFELKNIGAESALLGQASIEVLQGCCPQNPIMGSLNIQPGSTTTVAVPMMMHKGMDGPHLFHVTVPVLGGDSLHLYVRADFR